MLINASSKTSYISYIHGLTKLKAQLKMVRLDEVDDLVNQMMKAPIFLPSDKHRLLEDENKGLLDPNLIMDARHKIIRNMLSDSGEKCSALDEAKRLLKEEEIKETCLKKEQHFLETQLRRFEKELYKSRPKFQKQLGCNRKNLANSDDENFWKISSTMKTDIRLTDKSKPQTSGATSKQMSIDELSSLIEDTNRNEIKENERYSFANIKVTIRDKISSDSEEEQFELMKKYFVLLRKNAMEERRFRDMKIKMHQNIALRMLRRFFKIWKSYTEDMKNIAKIKKEAQDKPHHRKIEIFINEIAEKQKELTKIPKQQVKNNLPPKSTQESEDKKKLNHQKKYIIVESPAQNRLSAQKAIIEKQRSKLAEQNRIIEELRLKQIQEELAKMDKETVNTAKETLMNCGQETRRTLIQLMRQAGYRDKSMAIPQQVPSPPKFLVRMEARAEARRERIKKTEEIRRKKLEEQKLKEETAKREEEEKKKRLQQEAAREARRLREEQEKCRLQELERLKELNSKADKFYQKYLLRHYVKSPCMKLLEIRNNSIKKADDHYKETLLLRTFTAWRRKTEEQYQVKLELAMSVYNRNLLWYAFKNWRNMAKEENKKSQVAKDFHDMKLQEKCFHAMRSIAIELKFKRLEDEQMAQEHYEYKLKNKYFKTWRDFPAIAEMVKESEKQRKKWREIVQEIVPDFDPKERGVALED